MRRIAVYRHAGKVWYDSFAEIVEDFCHGKDAIANVRDGRKENRLWAYIGGIALYNVCYRTILRNEGVNALLSVLFKEAPAFQLEDKAIECLKSAVKCRGTFGDYDIQCLSTDDSFCAHGRTFNGLDDVRENIEWYMRRRKEPKMSHRHQPHLYDVHILCNYEPYPIFDSSDWGEDRTYCNFFFKRIGFTSDDFRIIADIPDEGNFKKTHEHLACVNEMPLLYYPGDGNTMLYTSLRQKV